MVKFRLFHKFKLIGNGKFNHLTFILILPRTSGLTPLHMRGLKPRIFHFLNWR